MMLNYLGLHSHASLIHNALLKTIEDGQHTRDISGSHTVATIGTKQFTKEVIARLGDKPSKLIAVDYAAQHQNQSTQVLHRKDVHAPSFTVPEKPLKAIPKKEFVGVDIFVDWDPEAGRDPAVLAQRLNASCGPDFKLTMISNRGVVVWPNGHPNTHKVDHWRCRFEAVKGPAQEVATVAALMSSLGNRGLEVIKTENLYNFDGEAGYSKGQGQ